MTKDGDGRVALRTTAAGLGHVVSTVKVPSGAGSQVDVQFG